MSKKNNSRQGLWRFVTINLTAIILFSVMKLNSFLVVPYSFVLVQMMNEHICSALFLHLSDRVVPKEFLHQRLPQKCVAVCENLFFNIARHNHLTKLYLHKSRLGVFQIIA